MRLNQKNLRATLASVFGVDQAYVVPRQGNWWNPQAGPESPAKPLTWCAFRIERARALTVPHFVAPDSTRNWSVAHKISRVTLQFVGDQAEDMANSIAHWVHNTAVQAAWDAYDGKMAAAVGDVVATDFDQDGENVVLAYNVWFDLVYADELDSGQSFPMPGFVFQGSVAVK